MGQRDLSDLSHFQRYNYIHGYRRGMEMVQTSLAGFGIAPTDQSRESGRSLLERNHLHFHGKLQAMGWTEYSGDDCREELLGICDAIVEWRSILD